MTAAKTFVAGSVMCLLTLAGTSAQAQTFSDPVTYTLESENPGRAATGDLDGDGDADIAVPTYVSGSTGYVEVLLDLGSGSSAVPTVYDVGNDPRSVAAADLDGDGDLDLAVANRGDGTVSVLVNRGDGTFEAAVDHAAGSYPFVVVAGDLNSDGLADLAVANTSAVSWLANNGDGTFAAPQSYSFSGIVALDIGEIEGDTDLDLVVLEKGGGSSSVAAWVTVLWNDGSGTFAASPRYDGGSWSDGWDYALHPSVDSVALGDVTGNGYLDVLVGATLGWRTLPLDGSPLGRVQVLENWGGGSLLSGESRGSCHDNPPQLDTGDLDGDGHLDIVTGRVYFLNGGTGYFGGRQSHGGGGEYVTVDDLYPDGLPDLVLPQDPHSVRVVFQGDVCPSDPNKTDPGQCGCGGLDTDSDADGVADCNDECPGEPDTDSDGDRVVDCLDPCPDDPSKVDPGLCGCGSPDVDSDGDGVLDCDDPCPDDPDKIDPGVCGCGIEDVDSDGDGVADCIDQCPGGPDNPLVFTLDKCPGDPNKVDPGCNGCGVPDTDSDGDGVMDCDDVCQGFDDATDCNGNGVADGCDIESGPFEDDGGLTASDGEPFDELGTNVAIDGNAFVVAAPYDDDRGTDAGSVYVYRHDPVTGGWAEEQKLTASDGAAGDSFGRYLSIQGDTIAVGAWGDDDQGLDSGSAYVYRYDGATWNQEQKLTAFDGAAGDEFGEDIAIHGDTIAIGAWADDDEGTDSGSVYVYRYDQTRPLGDRWVKEQKLTAGEDGAAFDRFGYRVSIHGDTIVVGALQDDDLGLDSGSAYVYRYDGSTWNMEQKLTAFDGTAYDRFGLGVSIHGDTIVVGAPYDDDPVLGTDAGSAYVYRYDPTRSEGEQWVEQNKLTASGGDIGDLLGEGVSTDGGTVVVGAPYDNDSVLGDDAGSVYVYRYDGASGLWVEDQKLTAPEGELEDKFGYGVAVDAGTIVAGSYGRNDLGADSGAVYTFERPGTASDCNRDSVPDECQPDTDLDGRIDACDCAPDNAYCSSDCTDGDVDGYCVTSDCDDASAGSWATPGEVAGLRFGAGTKDELSWDAPAEPGGDAPRYDAVRSEFADDFGAATCIESGDGSDRSATDLANPASGSVFHYLVRAANDCPAGQGTLGHDSQGAERSAPICP